MKSRSVARSKWNVVGIDVFVVFFLFFLFLVNLFTRPLVNNHPQKWEDWIRERERETTKLEWRQLKHHWTWNRLNCNLDFGKYSYKRKTTPVRFIYVDLNYTNTFIHVRHSSVPLVLAQVLSYKKSQHNWNVMTWRRMIEWASRLMFCQSMAASVCSHFVAIRMECRQTVQNHVSGVGSTVSRANRIGLSPMDSALQRESFVLRSQYGLISLLYQSCPNTNTHSWIVCGCLCCTRELRPLIFQFVRNTLTQMLPLLKLS